MPSRREFELFLTLRGALGSDFSNSMRRAQTEFRALRTAMSSVNGRMRDISAYQRLGNAMRDNEQRLQDLQQSHREIQDAMRQTNAPSEQLRRQLTQNESQIRSLTDRMTDQRHELERLSDALSDARIDTNNLTDTAADLQRQYEDLGNCRRNLENINEAIDTNKSKLRDATSELRNMIGLYAGIGTAAYTTTVKPAMAYESAFTGVLKTVDGTKEQLSDLRSEMIDMSQTDVIASAKEIAAVGEAAGQLGIHTENIADFSKVMIYLGDSTNLASTEAAESLAKFANITKMPQTEFSRLGSVIVDLGNNMATTERDIVELGTRLASTGELTGLSEAEIMGFSAALSSLGIEAEAGGTAASKILKSMELAFARGDMSKYANAAGMTADAFAELYQSSKLGAISAFTKGLNDVDRNGKSAVQILDDMGITEVRLSNAVLALAASDDVLTDAANIANKAWDENTALSTEAEKRYQTTESRIQLTKNAVENLGIALGDLATPFVRDLADDFTEAAMRAQRFVRENGDAIKSFASNAVEVGKLLLTLKALKVAYLGVKGGVLLVGKAIATFTTICATAKTMTGGMTFANLIKSFSAVTGVSITAAGAIAGVTVAVAAVGLAIWKSSKDVQAAIKKSNDAALFNNGGKKLSELVDEFKAATAESKRFAEEIVGTNSAHEENRAAIKKAKDEIFLYSDQLKDASGMTSEAAEALKKPFEDLSTTLKEDFGVSYKNIFNAFSDDAKKAADDFGVDVGQISGVLDSFNKKYNSAVSETQKEINTYLENVQAGGEVTQEDLDNYLKNVEFMQAMAEAREGKISSDDVKQKASEIGKLDLGGNREEAIQTISDFSAYIKDYTGQLTEAQETLQKEFATARREAKTLHDYGEYSDEEYALVKEALGQAEAVTQLKYDQKIADAIQIRDETAAKITSQIDKSVLLSTNDALKDKVDGWALFLNTFGNRDYYDVVKDKAESDLADVSKANDDLRQSVQKPLEISADASQYYEEMKKVKAAKEEVSGGGVVVAVEPQKKATAAKVNEFFRSHSDGGVKSGNYSAGGTLLNGLRGVIDFYGGAGRGYAAGTDYAQSGWKLVGENGPELLQFHGGERVYNARETAEILSARKWVEAAPSAPSAPSISKSSSNSYNITVNPTFYGGVNGDADSYGEQIADEIIRRLDERDRDARRNAYY